MAGGMTWEEPPPSGRGYNWPVTAQELRSNPNEWLLVGHDMPMSVINAARQGSITALNPKHRRGSDEPGYEVRTRNNRPGPPKTASMYLRWRDPSLERTEDVATNRRRRKARG